MITEDQIPRFAVAVLRGQLRLMSAGMTIKGLSKTKALVTAGKVTGKTYKSGQHEIAAEDISTWLKENPA
tara:strand:+ start:16844 stop:17053 length:210 start_codon:yes stop_codon:yes gene_type:complete